MNITFAKDNRGTDLLLVDGARIMFENFAGAASMYNRAGDRNFCLVIETEEQADELTRRGWNVTVKPPREEGRAPLMFMKVKVKFTGWGPDIDLVTGEAVNRLDEETVKRLDRIQLDHVNMDIRAFDWETAGKTGRTAYLNSMEAVQRVNRFEARRNRDEEVYEEIM